MTFTNERLESVCRAWQKVLRLQDWDVVVRFTRASQMRSSGAYGECEVQKRLKRAIINLRDPIDDVEHDAFGRDIEADLVHELIHLHFALFMNYDSDTVENIHQERAIEQMAKACVSLKRFSGDEGEA